MNEEQLLPPAWMYRSEAFAEDLIEPRVELRKGLAGQLQRATLLAVPLGLALLGSAYGLMGAWA